MSRWRSDWFQTGMPPHKHPFWYESAKGGMSDWEETPWWMFWKPAMRRLVIPPRYHEPFFEYQHPSFVVREALEKRFGTQTDQD